MKIMVDGVPLIMLPEGKEARVLGINAGRGLIRRLIEMGFTENAMVKVVRSDRGRLIVSICGCRYALSKGMAMKIRVTDS
jgi:ferrous iron transport protein A